MKHRIFIAAFAGLLFGFIGFFVLLLFVDIHDAAAYAVAAGLMFFILLLSFLIVYEHLIARRYARFEKQLTSPVFYKTGALIAVGPQKVRQCMVYFCEAGIVCASFDEKPYLAEEVLLPHIARYDYDHIHLNIITNDNRIFCLTLSDVRQVVELLKEKAWI